MMADPKVVVCGSCGHPLPGRLFCTRCHLPVDMRRSGGVRDQRGRPFHDVCLTYAIEVEGFIDQGQEERRDD